MSLDDLELHRPLLALEFWTPEVMRPDAEKGRIFIWVPDALREACEESEPVRVLNVNADRTPVGWHTAF